MRDYAEPIRNLLRSPAAENVLSENPGDYTPENFSRLLADFIRKIMLQPSNVVYPVLDAVKEAKIENVIRQTLAGEGRMIVNDPVYASQIRLVQEEIGAEGMENIVRVLGEDNVDALRHAADRAGL